MNAVFVPVSLVWRHCFSGGIQHSHCDSAGWSWYYEPEEVFILLYHPVSLSTVVNIGWC